MSDHRRQFIGTPGRTLRACPVCRRAVYTVREPAVDEVGELVHYAVHDDGAGRDCLMSDQRAAIRAVAFTHRRAA